MEEVGERTRKGFLWFYSWSFFQRFHFSREALSRGRNLVNNQNKAGGAQRQRRGAGEGVLEHQPREKTELKISPPPLPPAPEKSHFIEFKSIWNFTSLGKIE